MVRTIPDDVADCVDQVFRILQTMVKAARHQSKKKPTHDGLYPVTVIMNGAGEIVCDDQGKPIVVIPPLSIARTDEKTVSFFHTEQMLSPKNVANLVDVHKATVQRAVNDGQLPKPVQISSRRVAHRLAHVQEWIANRQNGGR
jgi:predicted DNA-binding transcriptional regulator AlpA